MKQHSDQKIVFRDRAFCSDFGVGCGNDECSEAFTPAERHAAVAWWGGEDPPVQFADLSSGCPFKFAPDGGAAERGAASPGDTSTPFLRFR